MNERSGNDNDNGNDAIHAIMIMDHSRGGVLLERPNETRLVHSHPG